MIVNPPSQSSFFYFLDYYSICHAFSHTKKCAHVQLFFAHSVDIDIMSKSFLHFRLIAYGKCRKSKHFFILYIAILS